MDQLGAAVEAGDRSPVAHLRPALGAGPVLHRGQGQYCTILYYTVLYCTILYSTVLYCTCSVARVGGVARLRRGSTGAGQPDTGQRRAEARVPHSDGSRHRGHSHLLRYLVIWIWILVGRLKLE